MIKIICFVFFTIFSISSYALTWGQIFSGAGTVGEAWNEEEQRQLQNRKLQLEVERMNREAEIQKLELQNRMQQLQQRQQQSPNGGTYELKLEANRWKSNLPFKINDSMTLVGVDSYHPNSITYTIQLASAFPVQRNTFVTLMEPQVAKAYCKDAYHFKEVFARNGGIFFRYFQNGQELPTVTVTTQTCQKFIQ